MYPYHNKIKQRIKNGELIKYEFVEKYKGKSELEANGLITLKEGMSKEEFLSIENINANFINVTDRGGYYE